LVFEIVNLQFWTQYCSPLPAEGPVLYVRIYWSFSNPRHPSRASVDTLTSSILTILIQLFQLIHITSALSATHPPSITDSSNH